MSNSIAPGSSADVNVKVTALTTNPNVPVTYKTIILKKNLVNGVNILTQEMMSATNTKYVIKYDYTLAENITIPANCILEFDGGSITGGAIFSNNTKIANIPSNLYIIGRIYNTNGQMITSKGDVINRKTRLVYAVSTLRKDSQYVWLYDEYGISNQIKGSTLIGITECYVDITLNISQNGTISFIDYIPDVNYIINYLKNQGIFNSVFAIRFNQNGYIDISPTLFMDNLKSFELNVIQQLKSAGLKFENVFFANEKENWVSATTPENEYIPYLISIADAITELGYTPYIDSTNWYHLSNADTRLISHAAPSYNFYPSISMLDKNTIYNPNMINSFPLSKPAYGGLTYKDVGICESGVNSKEKALRNPAESNLTILGDYWGEAKIIFARVIKDFIDRYRIPFYGIWYTESLTDTVDLETLYNIYLNY